MLMTGKKLLRLFSLLFLFFIPFGVKKFILSFTGEISELSSAFLYGTDILLVAIFLLFFFYTRLFKGQMIISRTGNSTIKNCSDVLKNIGIENWAGLGLFFIFLFLAFVSVFLAADTWLAFYHFLRLLLAAVAGFLIALFLGGNIVSMRDAAVAIGASSVFQSIIGFFQFLRGKSVGLKYLGEAVIAEGTGNVARVAVDGAHFLRAYGTMPHANILAAFLILGLISLLYLFLHCLRQGKLLRFAAARIALISSGIFIILLGLALTFSRSGWIVAIISLLFFLLLFFIRKSEGVSLQPLILVLSLSFALIFFLLGWTIIPRAHLERSDPSVDYRILYNKMGVQLILDNPLGVGIGNQTLVSKDREMYQSLGIAKSSDWQPVHNIYLLMASEIGIFGLLAFLSFMAVLAFEKLKSWRLIGSCLPGTDSPLVKKLARPRQASGEAGGIRNLTVVMLASLLLFGFFDHFLWTLQSGRLMLWLAIGLVIGAGFIDNVRAEKPS